jgi:DNA mismatch repair protein MutS2
MKFFPETALASLEFDKIKELLLVHARTEGAKQHIQQLRIHTKLDYLLLELQQTQEYLNLTRFQLHFPNDFTHNLQRELKLLSIPGSALSEEHIVLIRKLTENAGQIFRWFDAERRAAYPALTTVIRDCYFEKAIQPLIDEVLDETGQVKDRASDALVEIRQQLYRKRQELRRVFDRIVQKLNKQGYLADIEESFMNGRRVLAVFAEQKRMVKGVLHAESDSRRTSFIEPEETTELNNQVFSLEYEEVKEVQRILRALTERLRVYAPLLTQYHTIIGIYDFIQAKAKLAADLDACLPVVTDKAHIELIQARHPLLLKYNRQSGKTTIPLDLKLDASNRILVISGPNAGGKTVAMKTVGLLQIMLQSGLLVPVHPDSHMGVFRQLMIHIGDTQDMAFELSTYSSHLKHMKHFMETANGKTLFFIDELGSGSDPNLGGAFAEVILEELAHKHAMGIVTTHYLNLKVMAQQVNGIINGAMQFDEKRLLPLYKLQVGQPGSSYTFSIAERIGMEKRLIDRARKLVNENQYRLDGLLNKAEQQMHAVDAEKKRLQELIRQQEKLNHILQTELNKEKHRQETERLRLQNKITEEKYQYVRDMERRLKALVMEWRKAENKDEVVHMIQALLFKQKEKVQSEKRHKQIDARYDYIGGEVQVGDTVKMKNSRQVGIVKELRGKKAVLQIGIMPMIVALEDLTVVRAKENSENNA